MKRFGFAITLLVYLSFAFGQSQHEITCRGLEEMGRGELGPAPNWAISYCNGEAEIVEKRVAESLNNFIFMQSYEALLDRYGAVEIAEDISRRMTAAGYVQADSRTSDQGAVTTVFVNVDAGTSYTVLLSEKAIDYYLLLIKMPFPLTESVAESTAPPTATADSPEGDYWIEVKPTVIAPYIVKVEVETNMPDDAMLSISLKLREQAAPGPFIGSFGTDFERVSLTQGKGEVTIDGNLKPIPPVDVLPSGIYEVQVAFHPLWAENRRLADDLGITESIVFHSDVQLGD
jgi:hypothetical protein